MIAAQVVAQLLLTYRPLLNDLFRTRPLGLDEWWRIAVVAGAPESCSWAGAAG